MTMRRSHRPTGTATPRHRSRFGPAAIARCRKDGHERFRRGSSFLQAGRLLAIGVLVASTVGVVGTESSAQVAGGGMEPFRAFSWIPETPDPTMRITPFVGVNRWHPQQGYGEWRIHADADAAAETLLARPAGQRVLFIFGSERFNDAGYTNLFLQAEDRVVDPATGENVPGIWPTHGVARAKAEYNAYFDHLQSSLNSLDPTQRGVNGLVLDMETTYSIWSMNPDDPSRWRAVEADPRFAALRATLAARHPEFNSTTMSLQQIADYRRIPGTNGGEPYLFWNATMRGRVGAAMNEAVYDPFRARFPGVSTSNYETSRFEYPSVTDPAGVSPAVPVVPDPHGHLEFFDAADGPLFGNTGAPTLYGWVSPNIVNSRPEYTVALPGGQQTNPLLTAFGQVIVAANMTRGHVRATLDAPLEADITPWIAPKSWMGESGLQIPWANTPYYDEMVYQSVLSTGRTNFMYWNTQGVGRDPATGSLLPGYSFSPDDKSLSDILDDVKTNFGDELPVGTPLMLDHVGYDEQFLVGAVRFADGRIVGRVTFGATDQVASFTISGTTMTVAADGQAGQWFTVAAVPEPSASTLAGLAAVSAAACTAWRRGRGRPNRYRAHQRACTIRGSPARSGSVGSRTSPACASSDVSAAAATAGPISTSSQPPGASDSAAAAASRATTSTPVGPDTSAVFGSCSRTSRGSDSNSSSRT